jgi:hypothetical protein
MLGCFLTVLGLTFAQGGFDGFNTVNDGIPRDLVPVTETDGDGSVPEVNRACRLAAGCLAIVAVVTIALVFHANPKPRRQRIVYLICAVLIIGAFAMAITALILDVQYIDEAKQCTTEPVTLQRYCVDADGYIVALVILDAAVIAFSLAAIAMLIPWSLDFSFRRKYRHWVDIGRDMAEEEAEQMAPKKPGLEHVHVVLIFMALGLLLIAAIALIVVTGLLHDLRERVTGEYWDSTDPPQDYSGWPVTNTQARLFTSAAACINTVLTLIPWPRREWAYATAFCFAILSGLFFYCFALDVAQLESAKERACPASVSCEFGRYSATAVFDFICGLVPLVYLVWQFVIKHNKSRVVQPKKFKPEDVPMHIPGLYEGVEHDMAKQEPPPIRPTLGVEVVEMEHPDTRELCLTVINVTKGGCYEEAGGRIGDILLYWGNVPIRCKADFAQVMSRAAINSKVNVKVLRTEIVPEFEGDPEGRVVSETVGFQVVLKAAPT